VTVDIHGTLTVMAIPHPLPSLLLTTIHAHLSYILQKDCELDLCWKRGVSWPFNW